MPLCTPWLLIPLCCLLVYLVGLHTWQSATCNALKDAMASAAHTAVAWHDMMLWGCLNRAYFWRDVDRAELDACVPCTPVGDARACVPCNLLLGAVWPLDYCNELGHARLQATSFIAGYLIGVKFLLSTVTTHLRVISQ